MKRCTGCDRTYTDDKLSFCTVCGAALKTEVQVKEPALDPFKTMVATPGAAGPLDPGRVREQPPVARSPEPAVNPSWDQIGANLDRPAPGQEPSRGLAMGAMICGLASLLCGVFAFLGPVAAILGFIALNKQRSAPDQYTGRGFALVGVITGILATLLFVGGAIVFAVMLATGGIKF